MLAQDDYTFLLEKADAEKPLPIELVDRIINQQQEQVIFKVKVTSADKFPVCGKCETVLNIDAKAFRQCTKACFTVYPCPIFPKELTQLNEASLEDICYFFDVCIKYITSTPFLRKTSFLRNLLCKSAALCMQEFEAAINQDKQVKVATTTKLVTNTAVQQTVDGFKQFSDSMKQLFNFKKNKTDEDITPSPNSDDSNKDNILYKDIEIELAVTDKIIQQQISFTQSKKQHIEDLLKNQHKFAISQAQTLSKINKIQNYQLSLMVFPLTEDSMHNNQNETINYLKYRQMPILNIVSKMSDKIQQLINEAKSCQIQQQKLQTKLQKGNNQDVQTELERIQTQMKQIDIVITSGLKEFQQVVSTELKNSNIMLFKRLSQNCEDKAGKYKHAIEAIQDENSVSVGLNHGCFQVTLK